MASPISGIHILFILFTMIAGSAAPLPDQPGVTRRYPIFGPAHELVTIRDRALRGAVFFIVSGHGGPDTGARGERGGATLCEDEYAYDVGLRLARRLLEHDARVYVIVRDPDDGIRDDTVLVCDRDETVWGGAALPVDQLARLRQRSRIVNRLARTQAHASYRRLLVLHVDSRSEGDRVDIFFYHHSQSAAARRTAERLQTTIEKKYREHQPWRGYRGTVAPRDELFMLRATRPRTVYIELGNIRNPLDQRRFVEVDNRQALANWLAEGLLEDVRRSR